ncbi:hypothetical protein EDB85DRAFT_1901006 [Lactarius pseudohatsudake]|nr:hypothetical protein EDB85DRAFT_1901006 [Lactarius pseudohatsudake]
MLRRSHLPPFSKPPEGNGTTLGTTSRPALMLARASPQNRDISISRLYPSHPVVLRSAAPTSTSPSPPPEGYGTTSRPGLRLSRASPLDSLAGKIDVESVVGWGVCEKNKCAGGNSSSIHLGVGKTTVAVQGAPRALVLPHTSTPVLILLARRRLSYTPALPTLVSKWRLAYQAKILIQIARSLFRFAWDWVRRRVIGPLENLMRRMGWRVEATLTARLNITTRSGDVFNQSLPLRLALPHNVVAAPGEGAEQV